VVHVQANGEPSVAVLTADQTLLLVPEFDGELLRRIVLVSAPEKLSAVFAVIGGPHPAA
jgi:hypothetical protein